MVSILIDHSLYVKFYPYLSQYCHILLMISSYSFWMSFIIVFILYIIFLYTIIKKLQFTFNILTFKFKLYFQHILYTLYFRHLQQGLNQKESVPIPRTQTRPDHSNVSTDTPHHSILSTCNFIIVWGYTSHACS